MKTFLSFIFLLLIIIGIASCDSSTSPDTREGQRIGTWMVYDTEAEWIGSGSKAKTSTLQAEGDTVHYSEPDEFSLTLYPNNRIEDELAFVFSDSTISESEWRNFDTDINSSTNRLTDAVRALGWRDGAFVVSSYFENRCNNSVNLPEFETPIPDSEILYLSVISEDSSNADLEKTISLNIAGLDSVAKGALGCN